MSVGGAGPVLPGLEWALSLGRLRVHRPGRRAVVETRCGWFVKVVPPRHLPGLLARYEQLGHLDTVPCVEMADADLGILVLERMPGVTLRAALLASDAVPGADELDDALTPIWDLGLVHGDFYEANVLIHDGAVTGLVDLDRSGAGTPSLDRATLLAHLDVLAVYEPAAAATILRYRDALAAMWGRPAETEAVLADLAVRAEQVGRTAEAAAIRFRARNEAVLSGPPRTA